MLKNINFEKIDFYDKDPFDFDLKELDFSTLQQLFVRLVKQGKDTNTEIKRNQESNDLSYWLDDFENEKDTYLKITNEIKRRGLKVEFATLEEAIKQNYFDFNPQD